MLPPSNGVNSESNPQARARRRASSGNQNNSQSTFQVKITRKQLTAAHVFFYNYLLTNVCQSHGRNTEGSQGGAHSIQYPVVTLGDYFQILSNELSISVPPPPSQPFQLSKHFYITFGTISHGAKAKTNAREKYNQCTSGVRSSACTPRRLNMRNKV